VPPKIGGLGPCNLILLPAMPKVKNNLQKTRKKFFEDLKNGAAG
jgi:hypothetical protein